MQSFRKLVQNPALSATAILTLTLGIGACTTMYSVVKAIMIEPLPVDKEQTLVLIWQNHAERGITRFSQSIPNFFDYREQATSFSSMTALRDLNANVQFTNEAVRLGGQEVTAAFTKTLGWPPLLGRPFLSREHIPGAPRVAMISENLWKLRFSADPNTIGSVLNVNGEPHEVVGVLSSDIGMIMSDVDLWRPLHVDPSTESRDNHMLTVVGRLAPESSHEQAEEELRTIAQQFSSSDPSYLGWGVWLEDFRDAFVPPQIRTGLVILAIAVGCVLIIACLNVANLLLSHALDRDREISVRLALGAGRGNLITQVFRETGLLAIAGTMGGIIVAYGALAFFRRTQLNEFPKAGEFIVDLGGLLFASLICIVVTLISGLIPAIKLSNGSPSSALRTGSRSVGRSLQQQRTRFALVTTQLAFSSVLLIAAVLLIKSFNHLQKVDPGFNASRLLTFQISPSEKRYGGEKARTVFYSQLIEELENIPGVDHVAMTSSAPFGPGGTSLNVFSADPSAIQSGESIQAAWRIISPQYFETMEIPLIEGRPFNAQDDTNGRSVIVISSELATQLWPKESALGKRLGPGGLDNLYTVVGVVGETRMRSLTATENPSMYFSSGQWWGWATMSYVVRTTHSPMPLAPTIGEVVRNFDPAQPIFNFRTIDDYIQTQLQPAKLSYWLLTTFALIAILLASVGIYGMMASTVSQRRNEIGIRMSVGAQRHSILTMFLVMGSKVASIGIVLGLAVALGFTRTMSSLVFGISVHDPLTFIVVPLLLGGVTVFACAIPALRAASTDPIEALRNT